MLYRAQANRRVNSNHALAYAIELANEHQLPVLFFESEYPHKGERFAAFVREGAADNRQDALKLGIGYTFDSGDAFPRLAAEAGAIVTDDYPLLPSPPTLDVACYAVDSSCIVPMARLDKREYAAYTIRPKIRKLLDRYLQPVILPKVRYRMRNGTGNAQINATGSRPPIGGRAQAETHLTRFLTQNLHRYAQFKNEPSAHATSNLSPYLHFGHISALEVALAVRDYAAEHKLIADEFLEELIVRRELAFNFARHTSDPNSFDNLPDWARRTLHEHASDKRAFIYSRDEFAAASTHDPLWNATQKEMLKRGTIHGYYRMYWGKKILDWSQTPEEALDTMVYIHDVWALDGRDPNTAANILWCLGLHDRPWPERPIFGEVRYMALSGMQRKTDVEAYIREVEEL